MPSRASAGYTLTSGFGGGYSESLLNINEKQTMQNLNDRLATYLEKVRSLEAANTQLEVKIREYYNKRAPVSGRDWSSYFVTIEGLRSQQALYLITLSVRTCESYAAPFLYRYESEVALRQGVEADIAGLRKLLDELTLIKADLETQIEGLKEELVYLKKNHEEELIALRGQLGGSVNVEVDSAPSPDLTKTMNEIREQYETLATKNQRELEDWYNTQVEQVQTQVVQNTETLASSKNEITELTRSAQSLEIELSSLFTMKSALENTLEDTKYRYGVQLSQLQNVISRLEDDLGAVRSDMERQSAEYKLLLDIKTRLEQEIATYRRLLEGEETRKKRERNHDNFWEGKKNSVRVRALERPRIGAMKAASVYAGAGQSGTRISAANLDMLRYSGGAGGSFRAATGYSGGGGGFSSNFGFGGGSDYGLLNADEKQTMQNLNDRLASYLEKVRALEASNTQLEVKIREYYQKQSPVAGRDWSHYLKIINDLHSQIAAATISNSKTVLQIDNARLTFDDFRVKFETELNLKQSVEADMVGLRRLMSELALGKQDLEIQIGNLKEELVILKSNHEENLKASLGKMSGSVNVEVDSAPGVDLNKAIAEIREEFDALAAKNHRKAEAFYNSQVEEVQTQVTQDTEEVQVSKSKLTELKRVFQSLEIELSSLYSMIRALESTVEETNQRYGLQLASLQCQVVQTQEELERIRGAMTHQASEYEMLLSIKTRLEMEIATYRRLLDGEGSRTSTARGTKKKVFTLIEEVVDGVVVSSRIKQTGHTQTT
uniref:IF rod domain-containing protein n=1 Tax=Latimeria chalumnae TaxID=7897 RepID=H3AMI6_LATCH